MEDERGRRFEVKLIAPVPAQFADQPVPRELRGGIPALMERQKRELRIYAEMLEDRLRQRGAITIWEAAAYMYQYVPGWSDVMRENRLTGRNAFTRWLQLYDKFGVVGAPPRQRVRLRGS